MEFCPRMKRYDHIDYCSDASNESIESEHGDDVPDYIHCGPFLKKVSAKTTSMILLIIMFGASVHQTLTLPKYERFHGNGCTYNIPQLQLRTLVLKNSFIDKLVCFWLQCLLQSKYYYWLKDIRPLLIKHIVQSTYDWLFDSCKE